MIFQYVTSWKRCQFWLLAYLLTNYNSSYPFDGSFKKCGKKKKKTEFSGVSFNILIIYVFHMIINNLIWLILKVGLCRQAHFWCRLIKRLPLFLHHEHVNAVIEYFLKNNDKSESVAWTIFYNYSLTIFHLYSRVNTVWLKIKTTMFLIQDDSIVIKISSFLWRQILWANTIWLKGSADSFTYLRTKILGFLRIIRKNPRMPWPS